MVGFKPQIGEPRSNDACRLVGFGTSGILGNSGMKLLKSEDEIELQLDLGLASR